LLPWNVKLLLEGGGSAFSNIYSAISSAISNKLSTFSDSLLPIDEQLIERRDVGENLEFRTPKPGFYDKLSVAMDRSGFQAPSNLEVITQASLGPIKRSPQLSFPDSDFNINNGNSRESMDIIFPSQLSDHNIIENPKRDTTRLKGRLVATKKLNEMTREEAILALNSLLDSPMGSKLLEKAARQAALQEKKQEEEEQFQLSESGISSRAAGSTRTVTASPIILSSTAEAIRLIQPIQFIGSSPSSIPLSSPRPRNFPTPTPKRLSSPNRQKTSSFNSLISSGGPKPRKHAI